MKCSSHNNRSSTASCRRCQRSLCDQCVVRAGDGTTLCNRCELIGSIEGLQARSATSNKSRERTQEALHKCWPRRYLLPSMAISIAAVLLTLILLQNKPSTLQPINLGPSISNPLGLVLHLQVALEQYAAHEQRYPENLFELLPDYLTDTGETRDLLYRIDYQLDRLEGYRLHIKDFAANPSKELTATTHNLVLPQ